MLFLIPMAWISFRFLDLTGGLTGGLIENIENALTSNIDNLFIEILVGGLIGLILIFFFPIHWVIFYHPEDIGLMIAVTVPWILCCVITSGIFAHSPKDGIYTSLAIGIGYSILLTVIYIVISLIPPLGSAIIDGLLVGLTDLPFLIAALTAVLEGCLIGAVFGGFIGSLKYKPGGKKEGYKKKKGKKESPEMLEINRVIEKSGMVEETSCVHCGGKLTTDDLFCTNCGANRPQTHL